MKEFISVMLCCNDANGTFTGRVRKIDIDDQGELIELESPWCSESDYNRVFPSVRIEQHHLHVGHVKLLVAEHRSRVGNIFWNRAMVLKQDTKKLVRYLAGTRKWQIVGGPIESELLPTGWADR